MERVLTEVETLPRDWVYWFFFSHDEPIPDCFNTVTREALNWGAEVLWYVEEDMDLPEGVLMSLMKTDSYGVTTLNYPDGAGNPTHHSGNAFTITGTGCLLVADWVFDRLASPPFRRRAYDSLGNQLHEALTINAYGLHDVDLSKQLADADIPITAIELEGNQFRVVSYNQDSPHDIRTVL